MTDWQPTNWRPPRAEKVKVRWREGTESKWDYPPKALNWTDRGEPFDIIAWRVVRT